jgi:hypothetical protein
LRYDLIVGRRSIVRVNGEYRTWLNRRDILFGVICQSKGRSWEIAGRYLLRL